MLTISRMLMCRPGRWNRDASITMLERSAVPHKWLGLIGAAALRVRVLDVLGVISRSAS